MVEESESRKIPIVYLGAEDVPILYANNFVIQSHQGDFILTVGQLSPPILLGSEEDRRQQVEQVSYVPVKVVARLSFTRARIEELISVLSVHVEKQDARGAGDLGEE